MKMAGSVEGAGFWLPTEFLSDDDFVMEKENFIKSNNTESDSEFCFPTEFPYDSETKAHQLLEKFWAMSISPESALAYLSNGSPNGAPPPHTAPFNGKHDLIYLAAGQVAKLKVNRSHMVGPRSFSRFYPEPKNPTPSVYPNTQFLQKHQNESCGVLYGRQQMYHNRGGMSQAAWTPHQNPTRVRPASFGVSAASGGGCAAAKKSCAGTGVFLPRRYENISDSNAYPSYSHRKPGCSSVVQVQGKHFDNMSAFTMSQPQPQPRTNRGFVPDYNSLFARRHALAMQQQRHSSMSRDLYLPQEWTY